MIEMPMATVSVSTPVERPPDVVFGFIAADHVANHPRWDPNMSLTKLTPGSIGVGTRIHRSYMQGDARVEGEMEVTEYELDRAFGVVIRDGPAEFRSRMTVEPEGATGTLLTVSVEADVPVERMNEGPIRTSVDRMKTLIEAET